jgi:hypothetical protein
LVAADGSAAICPRTESPRRAGAAGWLHRLTDAPFTSQRHVRHVTFRIEGRCPTDWARLAADYGGALDTGRLDQLARRLGLSSASLIALGVGWSAGHSAYTFPMADAGGRPVGIRLRRPDGRKFAVPGSRDGLFLPPAPEPRGGRLLIAEGPTDAAALLDLAYALVVGRPSCTGGVRLLCELVGHVRSTDVVIVCDADGPGRAGADNLASALMCHAGAVRVVAPPGGAKDARDFLRAGGTRTDLDAAITATPPRRLRVAAGRAGR